MADLRQLIPQSRTMAMQTIKKGPGPFLLEGEEPCPFCEDENRIPVVINNNLSTEIKKIPLRILRGEQGLNQFADVFHGNAGSNSVLKRIYSDSAYKAAHVSTVDPYARSQPSFDPSNFPLAPISPPIPGDDILGNWHLSHNRTNLNTLTYPMQSKQHSGKNFSFDFDQEFSQADAEKSRQIGQMINTIIEDYKRKFNMQTQKDQLKKSDCNTVGRKALHICRQKDPYLREINLAIFGGTHSSYPKENTDEYYKLAQEYALLCSTPLSSSEVSTSKNDYSPSKNIVQSNAAYNQTPPVSNKTLHEIKSLEYKRSSFEDPSIIQDDLMQYPIVNQQQHQQQQQQQQHQLGCNTYPTSFDTSNFFLPGTSAQTNFLNQTAAGCMTNALNPYQMPGSFLAYNNLNTKTKPRTAPKLSPAQMPMFLTPHQYLMQASQATNFPGTSSYPQTLLQPQPNFANLQATPFYNGAASFKETHINTAIIQQHQYQQYNVLAAAAAGSYEMLVYEQMLHQTQKIKTVVARNRLDKRIQSELAKNALKIGSSSSSSSNSPTALANTIIPSISSGSKPIDSVSSVAVRNLFTQMSQQQQQHQSTASGGKTDLNLSSKATDASLTTCISSDLETSKSDPNVEQIADGVGSE